MHIRRFFKRSGVTPKCFSFRVFSSPVTILPSRKFADLRAPQINLLTEKSIIIQPLGAIEQHGPHLPLSTDSIIATEIAEAAVNKIGEELDAYILPTIHYTKSNEHSWSNGTIWLQPTTLLSVLNDLGRCISTTRAKRLVFFNAHGGNTALLGVALRELRIQYKLMTFLAHSTVPPDHGGASASCELGMGIHGGQDETSMMLHLAPHLVDLTNVERHVPSVFKDNKHVKFGGDVSFGWLSNDFYPDGYIGDPTQSSAEAGKKLVEGSIENFCASLREISKFSFEEKE